MASNQDANWEFRFGTNGWRGVLGEDFTFPRLRAVLRGVGSWLSASGGRREVLIAHDTRFMGEHMSRMAAGVLREAGLEPLLAEGPTATPVAAHGVLHREAAGGLVFTASHNSQEYHGLKILGPQGACIGAEAAAEIEGRVDCANDAPVAGDIGSVERVELSKPYVSELLTRIDTDAIRAARVSIVYDAMHGAGSGVVDRALELAGARVRVRRGSVDPSFGGAAPDPVAANLGGLRDEVQSINGQRLGLATDGDADRFAVVDADGQLLTETESLALLVDHLARTGRISKGVAVSIATGSLVSRIAADHGLRAVRHPIGFSELSRSLIAGDCDVAGEESGGFAIASFSRDKDGMMACGLMVELLACLRAPLRTRLDELERRHGASACGRVAVRIRPENRQAFRALMSDPPVAVNGRPVRCASTTDGLHLALDDGFLMLRLSGTEPVLRVYAEAQTEPSLRRRLTRGIEMLGAAGR